MSVAHWRKSGRRAAVSISYALGRAMPQIVPEPERCPRLRFRSKSRQEQAGGQADVTRGASSDLADPLFRRLSTPNILIWSPGAPRHQAEVTIHGQAI